MSDVYLKTPRGSFSLLDGFAVCERRHFFDRSGPRQPSTPAMLRGSHAHDTLEALAKHAKARGGWDGVFEGFTPKPGPVPEDRMKEWLAGVQPLLETTRVLGVERWFDVNSNEWNLCGKIDLESATTPCLDDMGRPTGDVMDRPCVLDYKTLSSMRWAKSEWEARKSLQLAVYALVTGHPMAGFVYLAPNGDVRATIIEVDPEFLQKASRWLHETYERVLRCWHEARIMAKEGEPPEKAFSLAPVDHPFCSVKCQHWALCLGKE